MTKEEQYHHLITAITNCITAHHGELSTFDISSALAFLAADVAYYCADDEETARSVLYDGMRLGQNNAINKIKLQKGNT
jgi:hypothetical protein